MDNKQGEAISQKRLAAQGAQISQKTGGGFAYRALAQKYHGGPTRRARRGIPRNHIAAGKRRSRGGHGYIDADLMASGVE